MCRGLYQYVLAPKILSFCYVVGLFTINKPHKTICLSLFVKNVMANSVLQLLTVLRKRQFPVLCEPSSWSQLWTPEKKRLSCSCLAGLMLTDDARTHSQLEQGKIQVPEASFSQEICKLGVSTSFSNQWIINGVVFAVCQEIHQLLLQLGNKTLAERLNQLLDLFLLFFADDIYILSVQ